MCMMAENWQLRISLLAPDDEAAFFVRDLAVMLGRIVASAETEALALPWVTQSASRTAILSTPPSAALLREVGWHRAQWAPASTPCHAFERPMRRCRSGLT